MSTNCVECLTNKRTGSDLLCDDCRGTCADCAYYPNAIKDIESCPVSIEGTGALNDHCTKCPCNIYSTEETAATLANAASQAALCWEQKNRKELQK